MIQNKKHVIILGAGISGLTVSFFLNKFKIKNTIIEKDKLAGGLLKSFKIKDYTFDNFIHVSHAKNTFVKNFFKKSSNYINIKPKPNNLFGKIWIDHSSQFNLFPLPFIERIKIILSFLLRNKKKKYRLKNYENWLRGAYGNYFAKNFPMQYTEKYWATKAQKLDTSWIKFRMQEISFKDIFKGAFFKQYKNTFYSQKMRYPKKGGYESFLRILKKNNNIIYNSKLKKIDLIKKKIFLNNKIINYTNLVSTIPLTEFVNLTKFKDKKLINFKNQLRCTAGIIISIGLKVPLKLRTWFYIYNKDFKASRIYCPGKLAKDNCPKNKSSLQAEIFIDNKKKITPNLLQKFKKNTINKLVENKIIKEHDIDFVDTRYKKYANIIFDKNYKKSRDYIMNYYKRFDIDFIGRFGSWAYLWSDQCFMSGKVTAQKIYKKKLS